MGKHMQKIYLPLTRKVIRTLRPGEEVLLSGPVLTARDAAHKRLAEALESNRKIPISIKGETVYYTGPTPARPGEIIGPCGPTTSSRMDPFTPVLLKHGLMAMIGKGERSKQVVSAIKRFGAVYFVTIGGAGAYLKELVRENKVVAYEELGPEAIHRLIIEDFPAIVSIV